MLAFVLSSQDLICESVKTCNQKSLPFGVFRSSSAIVFAPSICLWIYQNFFHNSVTVKNFFSGAKTNPDSQYLFSPISFHSRAEIIYCQIKIAESNIAMERAFKFYQGINNETLCLKSFITRQSPPQTRLRQGQNYQNQIFRKTRQVIKNLRQVPPIKLIFPTGA